MRPILAVTAGLLVAALVAAGVTLAILSLQARTNTQQVNLRNGVTISEDSAIITAAGKAKPAVVSIVTQHQPSLVRGSGYLATTDGYIVTNINVIAGSSGLTVLIPGDSKAHDARLVDYDCQTGVAVIKIDKVSGLPTLGFADPTALVRAADRGRRRAGGGKRGHARIRQRDASRDLRQRPRQPRSDAAVQRHDPDQRGDRRRHVGRPAPERWQPGHRRSHGVAVEPLGLWSERRGHR